MADVEGNREAQRALYGEPLGAVLGRCGAVLGVSQARLASLLGLSAPMLSQLMSAHRVKIGNPAAVQRLQVLLQVVTEVEAGRLDVERAVERVESTDAGDVLTTQPGPSARDRAAEVQAMFRRTASAADHLAAAELVAERFPAIAELLRVYGAGREDEAVAHLVRGR